jgi:Protein of unknown function (DUF402)
MRFSPGQVVLRRHFQRDHLLSRVWVGHVAADDHNGLWLWIATGSPFRDVGAADGRTFREVPFREWPRTWKLLRDLRWQGDALMLHPPDAEYSVWFFFAPDGTFRSWYVNLEKPSVRWDDGAVAGVDTVDYDLDLLVQPDRSWRWKDEDEFAAFLEHPDVYWVDDPDAVRESGERVVKLIEAGEFPFDGTGCAFQPHPQWTIPDALPAGWDRPRAW